MMMLAGFCADVALVAETAQSVVGSVEKERASDDAASVSKERHIGAMRESASLTTSDVSEEKKTEDDDDDAVRVKGGAGGLTRSKGLDQPGSDAVKRGKRGKER